VLAEQLVSSYKSDPPDLVTVVLDAHGFADLLERLDFLRMAKHHEQAVIGDTTSAKVTAEQAARRLGGLEAHYRAITTAVAAQADAIAGMNRLLQAKRAALQRAQAVRRAALRTTRARGRQLQRALAKLQAQQASGPAALGPSGGWAIPYAIVLCESGGQNLSPNSAGASGYYQIIPGTWKSMGGSTPAAYLASKAEQDHIAASLWAGGRGASNWACSAIVHG
jgi:hypothetical protein